MANVQHSALTGSDLHVNKLHAATHRTGGTDELALDTLGAASNNTDLDVSITTHGLCPLLPNDASKFFNGVGGYTVPGGVPTGAIAMWLEETPPTGWLECDGASVLRASYPDLWNLWGTKYGSVDGTHFTIRDLRGYFLRGWDHGRGADPDAATRTDRGDGVTGDHVGTGQPGGIVSHTHPIANRISASQPNQDGFVVGINIPSGATLAAGATGGSETRPINIDVMFIVKT